MSEVSRPQELCSYCPLWPRRTLGILGQTVSLGHAEMGRGDSLPGNERMGFSSYSHPRIYGLENPSRRSRGVLRVRRGDWSESRIYRGAGDTVN